jgi:hypothetical protein
MNTISTFRYAFAFVLLATSVAIAQDVSINIISQENGVNDGFWDMTAPVGTVTILITICNNDGGSTNLPSYKIRPLLSVPSSIVKIAQIEQQTGIPAGWSILTRTDGSIRLTNGTDNLPPGECREFPIYLEPVAVGGPSLVTATIAWGDGIAPGSGSGPQTVGNSPFNDNSATSVALPVTLVSFNVVKEGSVAQLAWITTEETNSSHFEVQRSANGKNWARIGTVKSNGESVVMRKYDYTDVKPLIGENLYRLRMVDIDGTFAYSRIRSLTFEGLNNPLGEGISVYPNPTSDKIFLKDVDLTKVNAVSILDIDGRSVYSSKAVSQDGINVRSLSTGMYVLNVKNMDGTSIRHKFLINR